MLSYSIYFSSDMPSLTFPYPQVSLTAKSYSKCFLNVGLPTCYTSVNV